MTTMSAQPSCSSNSSSRGLSCSRASSDSRWRCTARGSDANRPSATAGPSTTVTTASTVTRVRMPGQLNALTRGLGMARPEVSMTIRSGFRSRPSSASMVGTKSSATVQQMHPLASSRTSSSSQPSMPHPLRISPSMPMSPNSLTMSAIRRPAAFPSRCRMMLVLPAPRNPVITVAGIFWVMSFVSSPAPGRSAGRGSSAPDPEPSRETISVRPAQLSFSLTAPGGMLQTPPPESGVQGAASRSGPG